jgi:uncharacterized protein
VPSSLTSANAPMLDLAARIAVCDANYLRLLKLQPEFSTGLRRVILLPGVADTQHAHRLEIEVEEHFRYTTTLLLALTVPETVPHWYHAPRMRVRLYHDAATAEVLSYQDKSSYKAVYGLDDAPRFNGDEKMQINQFLAEWLSFCHEGGFAPLTLPTCLQSEVVPEIATIQTCAESWERRR